MKITELRDYQIEFEKIRADFNSGFKEINNLRKKFTLIYINFILSLSEVKTFLPQYQACWITSS